MQTSTGGVNASVDSHDLVSRADLVFDSPAPEPVQGHPVGNGRMGTMVWTTPDSVEFQINRVDVFATGKSHRALPQYGATDYCGACARISLQVGSNVFAGGHDFAQRLSLYPAEETVSGRGVRLRCFVSAAADVLVLELTDTRSQPQPMRVAMSTWRPDRVVHDRHVASLDLRAAEGAAVLTQAFREGDYFCGSAVAVRADAPTVAVEGPRDGSVSLVVTATRGTALVLIASAASRDASIDTAALAMAELAAAAGQPYEALREPHVRWWQAFWERSSVDVRTPDPVARTAERARTLFVYLMASSSRGALPPKWNGSIFSVHGDTRAWGSQYWVWTTEMGYFALHAAGCSDLADPFFAMYVAQLPDCRTAARQRWGCAGALFGETMPFDGPVVLPEDVAGEVRDVLAGRQPGSSLSARARLLGQFEGSLHVLCRSGDLAAGRYTWISHVCSSGAELAVHAWWRYRHTGDRQWLANCAYPLLRDTAEFYRTLVNPSEDGLYHLRGTNVHEDFWGATDSIMDLAAIRGTLPLAICAAELLDLDAGLRQGWQGVLDRLAPYPMGSDPGSRALTGGVLADDVWAAGHLGDVDGQHNPEDVWLNPVFPFEDWTAETPGESTARIVERALDLAPRHAAVLAGAPLSTAIRTPIAIARARRAKDLPKVLAAYWNAFAPLPNGLSLFEGADAHSVEHLGLLAMTLQEALLQGVSPRPGEAEVISVFPAWPGCWDAGFRLHARGGFEVRSRRTSGEIEFVEIRSQRGEVCRLRNPWGGRCRVETAPGGAFELAGEVLHFDTVSGETYRVLPVRLRHARPRPCRNGSTT